MMARAAETQRPIFQASSGNMLISGHHAVKTAATPRLVVQLDRVNVVVSFNFHPVNTVKTPPTKGIQDSNAHPEKVRSNVENLLEAK